jgi:hypothetical protein
VVIILSHKILRPPMIIAEATHELGYHREAIMATLPCLRAAKERRSCSILCVSLWYRRMWRFSGCGHCGGIRCSMAHSSRTSAFYLPLPSAGTGPRTHLGKLRVLEGVRAHVSQDDRQLTTPLGQ